MDCAASFGYPSSNGGVRFCYRCNANLLNRYMLHGISEHSCGTFDENNDDHFMAVIRKCETNVEIGNREAHVDLINNLAYDKKVSRRPRIVSYCCHTTPWAFRGDATRTFILLAEHWPHL